MNSQGTKTSNEIEVIQRELLIGKITFGQALAYMRKHILGLNQKQFSSMCGFSVRTLSLLENDDSNTTLKTMNQAFKIFGLKVGLVPAKQDTNNYKRLLKDSWNGG